MRDVIADSSAWIEFLRSTGSEVDRRFDELMETGGLVVPDPVLMEILEGARTSAEWRELRRLLGTFQYAPVRGPHDWIHAAALRREARVAGRTVASAIDCLIAAVAIRIGSPVLHADRHFDLIAEHSDLQLA